MKKAPRHDGSQFLSLAEGWVTVFISVVSDPEAKKKKYYEDREEKNPDNERLCQVKILRKE